MEASQETQEVWVSLHSSLTLPRFAYHSVSLLPGAASRTRTAPPSRKRQNNGQDVKHDSLSVSRAQEVGTNGNCLRQPAGFRSAQKPKPITSRKICQVFDVRGALGGVQGLFSCKVLPTHDHHAAQAHTLNVTHTQHPFLSFRSLDVWNESDCGISLFGWSWWHAVQGGRSPRTGVYQHKTGTPNCLNPQKEHSRVLVAVGRICPGHQVFRSLEGNTKHYRKVVNISFLKTPLKPLLLPNLPTF